MRVDRCCPYWVDLAQLLFLDSDLELGEGHSPSLGMHKYSDVMLLWRLRSWRTWESTSGVPFPQEGHPATHKVGAILLSHLFLLNKKEFYPISQKKQTHVLSTLPEIAQRVTVSGA